MQRHGVVDAADLPAKDEVAAGVGRARAVEDELAAEAVPGRPRKQDRPARAVPEQAVANALASRRARPLGEDAAGAAAEAVPARQDHDVDDARRVRAAPDALEDVEAVALPSNRRQRDVTAPVARDGNAARADRPEQAGRTASPR